MLKILDRSKFQSITNGKETDLFYLKNSNGIQVAITNYGAKVQQLLIPNEKGDQVDILLGYDNIESTINGHPSMNAFIGRYANRIANSTFRLDGKIHKLTSNSNGHCLHGGFNGSRFQTFDVIDFSDRKLSLLYNFVGREDSFPGNLKLNLEYSINDRNHLIISWIAKVFDKPTVASFTSHLFFNLNGIANTDICNHIVEIPSKEYLPINSENIPLGDKYPVLNTPMDFRVEKLIKSGIDSTHPQIQLANGYDHYYIINRNAMDPYLALAARVKLPDSNLSIEVWTTEPGLQFYTGNNLGFDPLMDKGKFGVQFIKRAGLCIEPSRYPNAPNQENFPSSIVRTDIPYQGRIEYRIST
ncbi:aldose epimerase family protein [Comamonas testosteroni]|uniref:aldose epimerase family protein n=1 Tax=Comamonas testosteroni TaxID=285 RepID=UPI002DBCE61B|nr:aldose epimerase family protein [Comamonas testosteroni]MEB5967381.1 galactose mutarotase [Comamonas testosteroni]